MPFNSVFSFQVRKQKIYHTKVNQLFMPHKNCVNFTSDFCTLRTDIGQNQINQKSVSLTSFKFNSKTTANV